MPNAMINSVDSLRFMRLFLALTSARRAWWSVPDLMAECGYSRAAVYRNLAKMEELHVGLESCPGVLPEPHRWTEKGWRSTMVLVGRGRS